VKATDHEIALLLTGNLFGFPYHLHNAGMSATGNDHEIGRRLQCQGLLPDSVSDFSGRVGPREDLSRFDHFFEMGSK
jgi:hypothetical protein